MKVLRVLVACEESQTVTKEFRKLGHEAFSCDIQECSGGNPDWHIQYDVTKLLQNSIEFTTSGGRDHWVEEWDLIIAHPPCTYMSNAGACRMYPTKGNISEERLAKAMVAKDFFMEFYNSKCKNIVIENPQPLKIIGLPIHQQTIQPYQFGDPFSKRTLLWIKGVPELKHTNVLDKWDPFIESGTSRNKGKNLGKTFARGSKGRSKTFPGIAKAMAEQWSEYLTR